jgi:hypothetical protein
MMNHIMVDLETLAEGPNAVFPSLAAVQFDMETGEMGKRFSMNINIDSAVAAGLVVDASTVAWWFTQPHEVSALMFKDPKLLGDVLTDFRNFLSDCAMWIDGDVEDLTLWGNSSRYDLGKLAWAYKSLGFAKYPWNTWAEKCFRTYTKLFPEYGQDVKKHNVKHDPIQDCEFQIRKLVEVNKQVKLRLLPNSEFINKSMQAEKVLKDIQQKRYITEHILDAIDLYFDLSSNSEDKGQYKFDMPGSSKD